MSKVLIVDDYRDATDTLAQIVRTWGYECRSVYDGACALQVAVIFQPDAVLLDIGMPEMDGYRVVRHLRSFLQSGYILAVTGYGTPADVERCRVAGFDGHLLKPIDPAELRGMLMARMLN